MANVEDRGPRRGRGAAAALVAVVAAVAVASATAAGQEQPPQPPQEDALDVGEEVIEVGQSLYARNCGICHGPEGIGIPGVGPPLLDSPPALVDFMIRTGRMPLPPGARVARRDPLIDDDEARLAIVAYVATFAPDQPAIPDVEPLAGELALGREVYETNCIACHSAFGSGVAITEKDIAPALHLADPVEIAEAVRTGPGVMPLYTTDQINEEEMNSLIRYILFIRDRPKPGGWTLGRSGPVTEGLVSWTGGLVALLVAAYFIGERRGD